MPLLRRPRRGHRPAFGEFRLDFPLPAGSYRQSSPYGYRIAPAGARRGERALHNGVDLAAPTGTPVYAAAGGVVVSTWRDGVGRGIVNGNAILLAHADATITGTAYLHLSEVLVRVGELVRTGQLVGRVERTGQSTGPHLHFMVYRRGTPVDPLPYLRAPSPASGRPRPGPLTWRNIPWWVWTALAGSMLIGSAGAASLARPRPHPGVPP